MDQPWVETKKNEGDPPRWFAATLWQMMGLKAWWRFLSAHSFRMSPTKIPRALSNTVSAAWISAAGLVQSAIFGRRLRNTVIRQDPIFVLGHWRSGTTHLHDLLSLDDRYACPTTFECTAPHHCLITERIFEPMWGWLYPKNRGVDGMALSLKRPQEDEFALLALGAPTPMWWIGYPDRREGQPFLSLRAVDELDVRVWQTVFDKFLRLLTYRNSGKPIVFKSPPHTARVALLAQMYPNARFVHIVRDPYTVFASTVHLWRSLHAISGMVPVRPGMIEAFVLECMKDMYADFDQSVAALRSGQYHQLRYEELAANPQAALRECYRSLNLGDFEPLLPRIDEYLRKLGGYKTNAYELSPIAREAVRQAWGPIYRKWGYHI